MATSPSRPKRGRPTGSRSFDPRSARAFGAVVRDIRLAKGFSQEALAHEAGLGRDHLSRIERGQTQPTLSAILRLARAVGASGATLIARTERSLSVEPAASART